RRKMRLGCVVDEERRDIVAFGREEAEVERGGTPGKHRRTVKADTVDPAQRGCSNNGDAGGCRESVHRDDGLEFRPRRVSRTAEFDRDQKSLTLAYIDRTGTIDRLGKLQDLDPAMRSIRIGHNIVGLHPDDAELADATAFQAGSHDSIALGVKPASAPLGGT